jgi:spore coat protein U-like protein
MRYPVAVALLLAATPAWAITCTVSTTDLSFGAYDVFSSSPLDTTATLTLECSGVLPADNITLDLTPGPHALTAGAAHLAYGMYRDADRTVPFGDGTGGSAHYGPVNPAATADIPVYGRISAHQDVPAGTYTDTIVVTVNY